MTVTNLFTPIMFYFDENGVYHAGPVRHALLIVQILLFLFTSLYVLHCAAETRDSEKSRHLTIGLFGLIMVILLSIQLFYPFLPLYTIGYMLGGCLLRTFVIENEREEYRRDLEASLHREEEARRDLEASIAREKEQFHQLTSAWRQAYTDVLTGVKSKLAYSDKVQQLDKALENGVLDKLAIVVFDLNDLKRINDTLGHDVGDEMIISACRLICKVFDHSPVYRIGGDEFAAILEGSDYEDREELISASRKAAGKTGSSSPRAWPSISPAGTAAWTAFSGAPTPKCTAGRNTGSSCLSEQTLEEGGPSSQDGPPSRSSCRRVAAPIKKASGNRLTAAFRH